ncbi:MAG: hypothetical protein U0900_16110 [Myxococcota bacterium]
MSGSRVRRRSDARVFPLLCLIVGILPGLLGADSAGLLGVEETETLVRRTDYEGMPEDEAARIGPAGAARLVEMLADPAERSAHARILLALGSCGAEGALDAIEGWAAALPATGELDRATFRAWQNLPFALGRLARRQPRAVEALVRHFDGEPPGWSFRHHRGDGLRRLEQRAVASALAETDRPEAAGALDALARRSHPPELADHLRAVQAEGERRRQTGASAAAADRAAGGVP